VVPRLARHQGRADQRLPRQLGGDRPRQPDVDAGVDQRLEEEEYVAGPRARDGGRHVEVALVLDLDRPTQAAEDGRGARPAGRVDRRRGGPGRDAGADLGRRVRHRPHDRGVPEPGRQRADRDAGRDREHDLTGLERAAQRLEDGRHVLGFDRQDDQVGAPGGAALGAGRVDAVLARQLVAPLGQEVVDGDRARRHHAGGQHATDHRRAHGAAAHEGQSPDGGHSRPV
jgi:hypothetical protein